MTHPREFSTHSPRALGELRRREARALEAFFEAYFDRVYRYVHRMVGNTQDAEDITQTAFIKMHKAIHTLDVNRDPTPWVFTVAANAVRDFWRSKQTRDTRLDLSLDDESRNLRLVDGETPETQYRAARTLALVEDGITRLTPGLRAVVLLRDLEGLSYIDIARALKITEANARKRHSRALQELKEYVYAKEERDIS